jgi:hypothetical protein
MNYGEELAYWYLRFNGFFPITDFVIHKSGCSSDCDILAIRTPYVYEAIGGQDDDWDTELTKRLGSFTSFRRTIGLICAVTTEVKLRDFSFPDYSMDSAVDRLGFAANTSEIKAALCNKKCYLIGEQYQIAKLLIADRQLDDTYTDFLFLPLEHIRKFIKNRFKQYYQKFRDRIYFNSDLIQYLTWEAALERNNPVV